MKKRNDLFDERGTCVFVYSFHVEDELLASRIRAICRDLLFPFSRVLILLFLTSWFLLLVRFEMVYF